MAQQELIDGLIATYRELNNRVRPLPEERLTKRDTSGTSIRDILVRLRDQELKFSQALKDRVSGSTVPDVGGTSASTTAAGACSVNRPW